MSQVTSSRILLLGVENADGSVTGVTTGSSQPINLQNDGVVVVYLRSIGTTSGGTVTIEEADWGPLEPPYGGTWSIIGTTINASSFTGGAQLAQRLTLSDNAFGWFRVRISGTITGGGSILAALRSRGAM